MRESLIRISSSSRATSCDVGNLPATVLTDDEEADADRNGMLRVKRITIAWDSTRGKFSADEMKKQGYTYSKKDGGWVDKDGHLGSDEYMEMQSYEVTILEPNSDDVDGGGDGNGGDSDLQHRGWSMGVLVNRASVNPLTSSGGQVRGNNLHQTTLGQQPKDYKYKGKGVGLAGC